VGCIHVQIQSTLCMIDWLNTSTAHISILSNTRGAWSLYTLYYSYINVLMSFNFKSFTGNYWFTFTKNNMCTLCYCVFTLKILYSLNASIRTHAHKHSFILPTAYLCTVALLYQLCRTHSGHWCGCMLRCQNIAHKE
jgi:hypothetical protein